MRAEKWQGLHYSKKEPVGYRQTTTPVRVGRNTALGLRQIAGQAAALRAQTSKTRFVSLRVQQLSLGGIVGTPGIFLYGYFYIPNR